MKSAKVTAPSVHHFLFSEDRILGVTLLPAPQVGNNLRARSRARLTVPRATAKPIVTPQPPHRARRRNALERPRCSTYHRGSRRPVHVPLDKGPRRPIVGLSDDPPQGADQERAFVENHAPRLLLGVERLRR